MNLDNTPKVVCYPTLLAYMIKRELGIQPYAIAQFTFPRGVYSQFVRI